jgi:predicted lipid-binding transport protein (Tim44 family)
MYALTGNDQEKTMKRIYTIQYKNNMLQKTFTIIMALLFIIGFATFWLFALIILLVCITVIGISMWWKIRKLKKNPQFKAFMDQMKEGKSNEHYSSQTKREHPPFSNKDGVTIDGESREIN